MIKAASADGTPAKVKVNDPSADVVADTSPIFTTTPDNAF